MAPALAWFPVVGALLGAMLGGVYIALHELISRSTAAALVVALGAIVTGAFHEDGLADTADSYGGYTQEKRLEIMRDSRIGTFGTVALIVAVLLKVLSLGGLGAADGLFALVLAHTLARAGALLIMKLGPEARVDGMAATAGEVPNFAVASALILIVGAIALGPVGATSAAGVLAITGVTTMAARRHLGGTTGDVLGAAEQLGEIVVLILASEMVATQGWLWI